MTKQQRQAFEDKIRQAIRGSGLSLNELGKRSGLDHGRLSRFMREERDLTLAAANKLCEALGLELTGGVAPASPGTVSDPDLVPAAASKKRPRPRKGK